MIDSRDRTHPVRGKGRAHLSSDRSFNLRSSFQPVERTRAIWRAALERRRRRPHGHRAAAARLRRQSEPARRTVRAQRKGAGLGGLPRALRHREVDRAALRLELAQQGPRTVLTTTTATSRWANALTAILVGLVGLATLSCLIPISNRVALAYSGGGRRFPNETPAASRCRSAGTRMRRTRLTARRGTRRGWRLLRTEEVAAQPSRTAARRSRTSRPRPGSRTNS